MRLANILKLGGVAIAVIILIVGSAITSTSVLAGPVLQSATDAPTVEATAQVTDAAPTAEASPTVEATTEVTQDASPTLFPPCPPMTSETGGTEAPTEEASATAESTLPATMEGTATFTPGFLGIAGESVANCGTRVLEVWPNSPAEQAGIQVDDIIVGAGGQAMRNADELRDLVMQRRAGDAITLTLKRGMDEITVSATLTDRPTITPAPLGGTPEPTAEATGGATAEATAEGTPAQ